MSAMQADIERLLAQSEPDVEVLLAEIVGGATVRLFIDHPDGVSLELCERVSAQLVPVRERFALEVSSPGLDRPLTKPAHFERFVGRNVQVRTNEPVAGSRNFTGRLTAVGEAAISVETERGETEIPLDSVRRSNLVPELSEVTS